MAVLSNERRAARRSLRALEDLDDDGRARLRSLLTNSCLVILPTSSAAELVTSRLAPGSVTVGVASTAGLGIDHTVAVTEVLAGRGYDARPHLAAAQVDNLRHLQRILRRLRGVGSVLLVPGSPHSPSHPSLQEVATSIAEQAPLRIGIAATAVGGEDRARTVLEAAESGDWISTRTAVDGRHLASWVAEMRIRGLELPVELGVPGMVPRSAFEREFSGGAATAAGRRRTQWFEPTEVVAGIASEQSLDRLGITGLRIDTLNFLAETASWRQRLFDLAAPVRTV